MKMSLSKSLKELEKEIVDELKRLNLPDDLAIKGIDKYKGLMVTKDWSKLSVEEKKEVEEIIDRHYNAWLKKHLLA